MFGTTQNPSLMYHISEQEDYEGDFIVPFSETLPYPEIKRIHRDVVSCKVVDVERLIEENKNKELKNTVGSLNMEAKIPCVSPKNNDNQKDKV